MLVSLKRGIWSRLMICFEFLTFSYLFWRNFRGICWRYPNKAGCAYYVQLYMILQFLVNWSTSRILLNALIIYIRASTMCFFRRVLKGFWEVFQKVKTSLWGFSHSDGIFHVRFLRRFCVIGRNCTTCFLRGFSYLISFNLIKFYKSLVLVCFIY